MSAPAAIPEATIVATVGPYMTGIMLQMIFMGVLSAQTFDYYSLFPKDTLFNKVLVASLVSVCALQSTMDYKNAYRTFVQFYGDFNHFDIQDWSLWGEIVVTAVAGTIAQSFFLERCYRATKSKLFLVVGGGFIALSLACGIGSTVQFAQVQKLSLVPSIPIFITTWLSVTAVIDLGIATVLVWSLLRVKSTFHKTETVVTKLIRLTLETGSLTAIIAVLNLILYLALPGFAWHLIPQLIMGKLYGMCVLYTLGSRKDLRAIMTGSDHASYVDSRNRAPSNGRFFSSKQNGRADGITVTTTFHQDGLETDIKQDTDMELGRAPASVKFESDDDFRAHGQAGQV
ncbi:hypothetical protein BOTBODRAFT_30879 [Botryobasidium botryosum FD-172 SS1]|uniref:DUF6534 domain-containing protein n=1 Tax=Botryobasidium botryosum (strain FD-172 SS1) TaxID=930990 RepID=A0A067MXC3_BOTB1|nr:hypothetical protein BOTBODRAFT_30879 [Botryobasidium botryosum FD-172 SS1]